MSTLRINNIEAQSIPASPTIDEKVKVTNSSGDILVNIDGKTSGITTIGINTTDGNIKFDANSNVLITGILTATTLAGNFTPDSLEVGSSIKLGNAGVVTATSFSGSGASLTNLNGSNIASGTVPVARIGTGTKDTTTFYRGDGTFQVVSTDLVDDSSPQLGGDLDTNSHHILLDDNHQLRVGDGNDFNINHDSNDTYLTNSTGNLIVQQAASNTNGDTYYKARNHYIRSDGSNNDSGIDVLANGAVNLYHNHVKKAETTSIGLKVTSSGSSHGLYVHHSNGNEVARLAHNGSGDEGVLVLKDGGSTTISLNGESGQNSTINIGNGKIIIGGTSSNAPAGSVHITNAYLRLQAANQNSGNFSQQVGIEWSQESGSDVQVGKIVMRRDAWGGAPHNMDFYTRTYGNQVNRALILHHNQSATLTGSLTQNASDIRLKGDIQPITNALEKVNSLSGFTYNWNQKGKDLGFKYGDHDDLQVGLSAQDVEKVQPEVVKPAPISDEYKTIQYEKLVPLLVESIKELSTEVESLKAEVAALKSS